MSQYLQTIVYVLPCVFPVLYVKELTFFYWTALAIEVNLFTQGGRCHASLYSRLPDRVARDKPRNGFGRMTCEDNFGRWGEDRHHGYYLGGTLLLFAFTFALDICFLSGSIIASGILCGEISVILHHNPEHHTRFFRYSLRNYTANCEPAASNTFHPQMIALTNALLPVGKLKSRAFSNSKLSHERYSPKHAFVDTAHRLAPWFKRLVRPPHYREFRPRCF